MGGTPVRTRVGHSFIKQVMAETGAVFGGEHSGHYYFRDNWRADSGIIAAMVVLEQLSRADVPLSELRKPFERYAQSGEINTRVDDPPAVIEQVAEALPRRASRTASTASPSTSATGGSTCGRATPSRCSGSTSRRPTGSRAMLTPKRCWTSSRCRGVSRRGPGGDIDVALDPQLLEILACPEDKGPLLYFADEAALYNPRLKRRYAVRDDIPIMLIDEAETVERRRARAAASPRPRPTASSRRSPSSDRASERR